MADHEDEMIGVLLAGARPGQTRPDRRDLYDLARGALLIRMGRATGALSQERWRDAFAIVAVVAPLLLIGYCLFAFVWNVNNLLVFTEPGIPRHEWQRALTLTFERNAVWVTWGAVAVLVLLGRRWIGTVGAFVIPVTAIGVVLASCVVSLTSIGLPATSSYPFGVVYWLNADVELPVVLSLLSGVALWASPGAKRGYQLLGKGRLILLVALTIGFVEPVILRMYHGLRRDGAFFFFEQSSLLKPVIAVAVVAGVVSLTRSAEGRRACALLMIPLSCTLYADDPVGVIATPLRMLVYVVAGPLLAFAVIRYGARPADRTGPEVRR